MSDMSEMTPAERADFRIRTAYWWGWGLVALGAVGHLLAVANLDTAADPSTTLIWSRILLLVCLLGVAALVMALSATGARLGLASYGLVPDQGPASTETRRDDG